MQHVVGAYYFASNNKYRCNFFKKSMKNKGTTQNVVLHKDVVTRGNVYSTCVFMKIRKNGLWC